MEQSIASRAEWLARLADAIASAQTVAWRLRTFENASLEARELYDRLEVARQELDLLQGRSPRQSAQTDPEWLGRLGWGSALTDPAD